MQRCTACGGSGYRGRIALLELLVVNDEIGRLILRRADARDIADAAAKAGMQTLLGDGLAKAAAGQTTLAEALRVANEA
jgi:general secretion pathway protein E